MKRIELPDRNKDIIEEAFRLGWESAITLKDMIDAQSEECAIDNLRGVAYALYFEALHEKTIIALHDEDDAQIKEKRTTPNPYPCKGCDKEHEWQKKWGNKNELYLGNQVD